VFQHCFIDTDINQLLSRAPALLPIVRYASPSSIRYYNTPPPVLHATTVHCLTRPCTNWSHAVVITLDTLVVPPSQIAFVYSGKISCAETPIFRDVDRTTIGIRVSQTKSLQYPKHGNHWVRLSRTCGSRTAVATTMHSLGDARTDEPLAKPSRSCISSQHCETCDARTVLELPSDPKSPLDLSTLYQRDQVIWTMTFLTD
jgi:hypothetical protein